MRLLWLLWLMLLHLRHLPLPVQLSLKLFDLQLDFCFTASIFHRISNLRY